MRPRCQGSTEREIVVPATDRTVARNDPGIRLRSLMLLRPVPETKPGRLAWGLFLAVAFVSVPVSRCATYNTCRNFAKDFGLHQSNEAGTILSAWS